MRAPLAVATLRDRRLGFLGSALALLCAAALLTACGVLMQTGLTGSVPAERYAAAPLVVAADQSVHFRKADGKVKAKPDTQHAWLAAGLLDRLRALPAGRGAVADVSFPVGLVSVGLVSGGVAAGGPSWGHGWSSAALAPYALAAGRAPAAADEVVLDGRLAAASRLRVGGSALVETAAGDARFRVVGITTRGLADQGAVFFADAEARRLDGHPGQVFAIGLPHATAADAPAVRAALTGTGAQVVEGAARGALETSGATRARATLVSLSAVLGGTGLIVALLVVSATFTLAIGQRSRELALLRAIGATPRQLRRMIGAEALLVGLPSACAGGGLGLLVAAWLRGRFVAIGAMPAAMALRPGPVPVVAGVVLAVAGGWVAARGAARRTTRLRPAAALTETAVERHGLGALRGGAGAVAVAGFAGLLFVLTLLHSDAASTPVAFAAVLLAALAVALLGPLVARAAMLLLTLPMRSVAPRAGFLAAANNRANARRLTAVMTPLTLAVTIACAILFMPSSLGHAAAAQRQAGLRADAVVVGTGPGVPASVAGAARAVPGVDAVTRQLTAAMRLGQDAYTADGLGAGADRTVDLGVTTGSTQGFGAGTLALSTTAAAHHHVRVGDRVTVTLGDGTKVPLRLVATYERGLGFGDAVLPFDLLAAHADDPLAADLLVHGATPAALAAALHAQPGIRVLSTGAYEHTLVGAKDISTELGYLMMGLVVAFTAIAIVNTLTLATGARSGEFAALRLVGTARRQVIRMVRVETVAVVAASVVLGTLFGLAILLAYAAGMAPGEGPYARPATYATVVAAALALAVSAAAPATRVALRRHPLGAGRRASG